MVITAEEFHRLAIKAAEAFNEIENNSEYRGYCHIDLRDCFTEALAAARTLRLEVDGLRHLLKPFEVVTDVWCVSCDPDMHAESVALFTDEARARQFCEAVHGAEGLVEKRIITGRFGK